MIHHLRFSFRNEVHVETYYWKWKVPRIAIKQAKVNQWGWGRNIAGGGGGGGRISKLTCCRARFLDAIWIVRERIFLRRLHNHRGSISSWGRTISVTWCIDNWRGLIQQHKDIFRISLRYFKTVWPSATIPWCCRIFVNIGSCNGLLPLFRVRPGTECCLNTEWWY